MEIIEKAVGAIKEEFGGLDFENYMYVANYKDGSVHIHVEEDDDGKKGVKVEVTDLKVKTLDVDDNLDLFEEV